MSSLLICFRLKTQIFRRVFVFEKIFRQIKICTIWAVRLRTNQYTCITSYSVRLKFDVCQQFQNKRRRNVVKLNNKSFIASLCALRNIQGIPNFQEFSAQYIATTYAKSTQQTYIYITFYISHIIKL